MRAVLALAIMAAGLASAGEVPDRPLRVLVLSQYEPGLPASIAFTSGLRAELDPSRGHHVYVEYLDGFPSPTRSHLREARDWLRVRHAAPPDVIVAAGDAAIGFLADPETAPWPGVPVVFGMLDPRLAPSRSLPASFTGVTDHLAVRETVELALRLLPSTRHAVLLGGTSPLDRALADLLRGEVASFAGRLDVIDLIGLPFRALEERLQGLPDDSIVLILSLLQDRSGQIWTPQQLVPRISAAARAPLFSTHGTVLGSGIVGGVLTDWEAVGRRVAQVALRILAGEAPADIPVEESGTKRALLDGRQLDRWGVPDARVPAGVEIRFREPTLWSRYRWAFVAGLTGLVLQALLIVGLLVERRRRRRAETRARDNLAVVAHLNRVGAIAEMAGAFAHELNSPLGAVVNNAQAARRFILAGPGHAQDVAACLEDILGDARRAGEVVRRIRAHLRGEDVEPVQLDVSAVVRDAVHLVEMDAQDRGVHLSVDLASGLPPLRGDDVQLVQVVLNLVMNAVDAVAEVPPSRRRVQVSAAPLDGGVEIRVADSGAGIAPEQLDRLFDPFFTTKRTGLGLGLSISRSIVEAHGGSIRASPAPGGGTVFRVLLPAAPAPRAVGREATG